MLYIVLGTDCVSAHGDELYAFQTAEMASLFAGVLNRDAAKHAPRVDIYFTPQGTTGANQFQTYFRSADKTIARWDNTGVLVELDLPHIVWIWLRTTAPVRVAKALWKGWA